MLIQVSCSEREERPIVRTNAVTIARMSAARSERRKSASRRRHAAGPRASVMRSADGRRRPTSSLKLREPASAVPHGTSASAPLPVSTLIVLRPPCCLPPFSPYPHYPHQRRPSRRRARPEQSAEQNRIPGPHHAPCVARNQGWRASGNIKGAPRRPRKRPPGAPERLPERDALEHVGDALAGVHRCLQRVED